MKVTRRNFIGGAFAAGAWTSFGILPSFGIPTSGRIARIGHMTDTHVLGDIKTFSRVRKALELFKAKGVEMIINNGDIAEWHIPEAYRLYRKVTNEVYPDAAMRPREVFVYARHDWGGHPAFTHAKEDDYMAAFENVRKELQASDPIICDFVWKGLPFVVMAQFTGRPGFMTWEEYEQTIARVCAENPGKPVFVVDHVPPAGTVYDSWSWGRVECRRVLNKFPQVVSLSGHVHGSLANERFIWQGEFTAINAGCLQYWDGFLPGSQTNREYNKKGYEVLVLDVYADRLVAYRHDVRDGSEVGPAWVVPFPFVSATAPYRVVEQAKNSAVPQFADDAMLALSAKGEPPKGFDLTIPDRMGGDGKLPYNYRVRIQRKDAFGVWRTTARDDVMADWWVRPSDRKGKTVHFLHSGFFAEGGDYRLAVTPMDLFYREGRPLWIDVPGSVRLRTLWECNDPMGQMRCSEGEGDDTLEPDMEGWVSPKTKSVQLRFPDGAIRNALRGELNQLLVDIETDQNDGDYHAWRAKLHVGGCGDLSEFQTPVGKPGLLTYVMPFRLPQGTKRNGECRLTFSCRPVEIKGGRLVVRRIRIVV